VQTLSVENEFAIVPVPAMAHKETGCAKIKLRILILMTALHASFFRADDSCAVIANTKTLLPSGSAHGTAITYPERAMFPCFLESREQASVTLVA
jgi:hypothetical protein